MILANNTPPKAPNAPKAPKRAVTPPNPPRYAQSNLLISIGSSCWAHWAHSSTNSSRIFVFGRVGRELAISTAGAASYWAIFKRGRSAVAPQRNDEVRRLGCARAEWSKLSAADHAAIADRLRRDGSIACRDLWTGIWLRDRVWEETPPRATAVHEPLPARPSPEYADAGSALWRTERERLRAEGRQSTVTLMDQFAAAGRGWTCRHPGA